MERLESLKPEALCRHCDPEQFQFKTSAELDDLKVSVGQARAVEAVEFGTGIHREGYNLFAAGPTGAGKFKMVSDFLRQEAAAEPIPSDWCYVNRFDDPQKPRALELPPGQAVGLRQAMEALVEELRSSIPGAYSLEGRSIEVRCRSLTWAEGVNLLRAIQSDDAALLVLSLSSPHLPRATLGKLLEHISNPVLLIR